MAKSEIDVRLRLKGGQQFKREMEGAGKTAMGFGQKMKSVGMAMQGFGSSLTSSVTMPIIHATKKSFEFMHELLHNTLMINGKLRTTTEQASKYATVLMANDISTRVFTMGATKLSSQLEQASRHSHGAIKNFHEAGLSIDKLKRIGQGSGGMPRMLTEVIDKLQKMGPAWRAAGINQALFGRGSTMLAPIMGKNALNINEQLKLAEQYGAFLNDHGIKTTEDWRLAQLKLQYATMGLQIEMATTLMPAVIKITDAIRKAVQWFGHLDPKLRLGIIAFAALLGPVTMVAGSILVLVAAVELLLSPVTLIVIAVAALAYGFYLVWTRTTILQDAFKFLWFWAKKLLFVFLNAQPAYHFIKFMIKHWKTFQGVVSGVWNTMKKIASLPGKVWGATGGKIFHAAGGFIPSGTPFQHITGEAGPELVTSRPGGLQVTPLAAGALSGAGGYVPIVLQLDGRTVAENSARLVRTKNARS